MKKEEIIEIIESHHLKLDLDRWDDEYKEWMRFEYLGSDDYENFIFYKSWIDKPVYNTERSIRNLINSKCTQYWRHIGAEEKQNEIRKVLGI